MKKYYIHHVGAWSLYALPDPTPSLLVERSNSYDTLESAYEVLSASVDRANLADAGVHRAGWRQWVVTADLTPEIRATGVPLFGEMPPGAMAYIYEVEAREDQAADQVVEAWYEYEKLQRETEKLDKLSDMANMALAAMPIMISGVATIDQDECEGWEFGSFVIDGSEIGKKIIELLGIDEDDLYAGDVNLGRIRIIVERVESDQ